MYFFRLLFKRFAKDSLSIMIIPHTGEGIKQVKFKKFVFYSFITMICSVCILLGVLIYVLYDLNIELDAKIQDLSKLQTVNVQQSNEIQELKNKAIAVNQKLSILNDLETEVRDLVGLKTTSDSQVIEPISRSSTIRLDYRNSFATSFSNIEGGIVEEDENEIEVLATEMDREVENLSVLIEEVTGQLKVLDATPDNFPVQGRITSKFGNRKSPFTGRTQFHKGVDIANSQGTRIEAAGTGVVTFSGWNSGYGRTIIISHGYGYRTVYAHNQENLVTVGQKVKKGDIIGKLGSSGKSTGPHVHFEIHYQNKQIDPLTVLKN